MGRELIIILIICFYTTATAYRIGDAVGIILRTSKGSLEAYRHQMPRFGISTKTRFDISSFHNTNDADNTHRPDEEERIRFSISFDEGFHHIPWLDVYNKQHTLEKLIITFVYSASDGSIHAVHRTTKYVEGQSTSFTVEYNWIEEADVDIQSGVVMLFLSVMVVLVMGVLGECLGSKSRRQREGEKSLSFNSESFAKRL